MKYKTSRYDVLVDNENDVLQLDFILAKDDRKIIHGVAWDESDEPKRVPNAIVRIYIAGSKYHTEDPNDLIPIGYVISDENGEFFAGPFESGTAVIFKIFKTLNNYDSESHPQKPPFINSCNVEECATHNKI